MSSRTEFEDVREFITSIAQHTCEKREITCKDEQGTDPHNTFIGFSCSCGADFFYSLYCARTLMVPLRPYLKTSAGRVETAKRLTSNPKELLLELINSGGWGQPDPLDAYLTFLPAVAGPPDNPASIKLKKMLEGKPKPS